MITEDGTGTPGANSYSTLEQAADYHAARQNDAWAGPDDATREARLILATDYIEANYRAKGARLTPGQGLQWPTAGATGVPGAIVAATAILALEALSGPLMAPAERGVKKTRKKLEGVGELETEFDDYAPADPYPHVSAILADVATVRGATGGVGPLIMGQLTR